jgi:hypothetical protein
MAVLTRQGGGARNGRFVPPFLVSDVVAGLLKVVGAVWPGGRGPAAARLAGFAAMGGVFPSAATGRVSPLDRAAAFNFRAFFVASAVTWGLGWACPAVSFWR